MHAALGAWVRGRDPDVVVVAEGAGAVGADGAGEFEHGIPDAGHGFAGPLGVIAGHDDFPVRMAALGGAPDGGVHASEFEPVADHLRLVVAFDQCDVGPIRHRTTVGCGRGPVAEVCLGFGR